MYIFCIILFNASHEARVDKNYGRGVRSYAQDRRISGSSLGPPYTRVFIGTRGELFIAISSNYDCAGYVLDL